MLEKYVVSILELNWNLNDKIEYLSSYVHFVHTTAKQVISRLRKNENVFKMSKDEKCTCKKSNMQICGVFVAVVVVKAWLLKLRVRTHWTDKICLARPKMSTKFVSAKVSIW